MADKMTPDAPEALRDTTAIPVLKKISEEPPIHLTAEQQQAAHDWAADDRLWTTQEIVEANLRTFARVILKHARSPETPTEGAASSPLPGSGQGEISGTQLLSTFDGRVWAEQFCKATGFHDVEWAHTWFANAIMAGYDHARRTPDRSAGEETPK